MGRKRQAPKPPHTPRSANIDPMTIAWLEMNQLGNTGRLGPGLPHSVLKALSRTAHVAGIHQAFKNWGADFAVPQPTPYSIGWVVSKENRRSPYTPSDWRTIDEISEFIARGGWEWFPGGHEAIVRAKLSATLVHDWDPMEIIREEGTGKPWAVIPVDPTSIRYADPTTQQLSDYRWDFDEIAYVQVFNDAGSHLIVNEFSRDEMHVGVRRPSADMARLRYGLPEVEEFAGVITAIVNCITSNAVGITTGMHNNQIIALLSKQGDAAYNQFKTELQAMVSGVRNSKRTPVVRLNPDTKDDLKVFDLGHSNAEAQYMEWLDFLERLLCAGYGVDQQAIFPNAKAMDNLDDMKLSPTARALKSKERGFRPVLRYIGNTFNDIIKPAWPGFRFDYVGFDSQSERDKLEMDIKAVGSYLSPNELRADRNRAPFNDPVSNRPLHPLYQTWLQSVQDTGLAIPGIDTGMDNISAWVNGRRVPAPTNPA